MRVISGTYRGKKLQTLDDIKTRPTTNRVKENVFNLLDHMFNCDVKVLDLFGGSGQIGIEFASRGAKKIYINEQNKHALNIIKKNIKNVDANFKLFEMDAFDFVHSCDVIFDYIYIDGPYDAYNLDLLLLKLNKNTNFNSKIVIESSLNLKSDFKGYDVIKEKKYGSTKIWILVKEKYEKR